MTSNQSHSSFHHLDAWGLNDAVRAHFHDHEQPGRITAVYRGRFELATQVGVFRAVTAGRFHHHAESQPVTGDWVGWHGTPGVDEDLVIDRLLPRRSTLTRKAAGANSAQVLVANVDWVWIVSSLNRDWNPARLERYLTLVWESGAKPAVILSKCDLQDDPGVWYEEAEAVAFGTPIYPLSALTGDGVDALAATLKPGETACLLGSSGVGKSTLTNALLTQTHQETGAVRDQDQRGRHTTTHRELFRLPNGALLIDTPGLRELGLWSSEEALAELFHEVSLLGENCRFRDCHHEGEPGCAVNAALADGSLDKRRFDNYRKMQKEVQRLDELQTLSGRLARKQREKSLHKHIRNVKNR